MNEGQSNGNDDQSASWFRQDSAIVRSAASAVRDLLPTGGGKGVEITCGSRLFRTGLEISSWNASSAKMSGTNNETGALPFEDRSLDYVFVLYCDGAFSELRWILKEVFRTLRANGKLIIAFLDPESPSGHRYNVTHSQDHPCDTEKIVTELTQVGFRYFEFRQTLFSPPEEVREMHLPREGYGEGSFVVIRARKKM